MVCTMQKTEDVYATYKLTDEDLAEIHTLARDPKIGAPILWDWCMAAELVS
jgi:hypothetical protein